MIFLIAGQLFQLLVEGKLISQILIRSFPGQHQANMEIQIAGGWHHQTPEAIQDDFGKEERRTAGTWHHQRPAAGSV